LYALEKTDDAMAGLKKALAHGERHVQGEEVGGANVAEDEDDPPIALTMTILSMTWSLRNR
jgi:hypothetical protein